MSEYPYGYGHYQGQPPPNPYSYHHPPAEFSPPGYGEPHDPVPQDGYYTMAQSAFDYNGRIPGLGIAGTPMAPSSYHHPPGVAAWGHPSGRDSPYMTGALAPMPQPQPQYHYALPPYLDREGARSTPPHGNPALPSRSTSSRGKSTTHYSDNDDDIEEGELTEAQFEDLYETRDRRSPSRHRSASGRSLSVPDQSRAISIEDTPDSGLYGDGDEEAATSSRADTSRPGIPRHYPDSIVRGRSGSYSPYLSPWETPGDATVNDADRSAEACSPPQVPTTSANGRDGTLGLSGSQDPNRTASDSVNPDTTSPHGCQPSGNTESTNSMFKSLTEAKKEAQKVILSLWPHGVKYQHYIDEGFDESVIKFLFEELHLDISSGKPLQPDSFQASTQNPAPEPPGASEPTSSKSPATELPTQTRSQTEAGASKADKPDKTEERKDRIARLLAAKAKVKPAGATPPVLTPAVVTPPVATPPIATPPVANAPNTAKSTRTSTPSTSKPKTKEAMELLLQQKMEALQRSREARAQKTISENTRAAPVSDAAVSEASPSSLPQEKTDVAPTAQRGDATSSHASDTIVTQQTLPQQPSQGSTTIPGLFLSTIRTSTPQPVAPANQRKRPVAADFADYPSTTSSLKRPFGQERKDSSLIIDVSDGSDEEMDIDMDVDSPVEGPSSIQQANPPARKALSFRDVPPLTDRSQRQYSSPAPSISTPPAVPNSAKEIELLLKEKAIQEMRRKIAEAEAKRKAKKASVGSQTPTQAAVTTPEPKNDDALRPSSRRAISAGEAANMDGPSAQLISEAVSARLPKRSELLQSKRKELRAERRGRIVSLDLPRVDDALQEKLKKLDLLREEQAKLQAEINQEMAKKTQLTDELNQLERASPEKASPEVTSSDEGQQKDNDSGADMREINHGIQEHSSNQTSTNGEEGIMTTSDALTLEEASTSVTDVIPPDLVSVAPMTQGLPNEPDPQASQPDNVCQNAVHQPTNVASAEPAPMSLDNGIDDAPEGVFREPSQDGPVFGAGQLHTVSAKSTPEDIVMSESTATDTPETEQRSRSCSYEPPSAGSEQGMTDHVALESPSFSPEPADSFLANDAEESEAQVSADPSVPAQISLVAQPREPLQEIQAGTTGQIKRVWPSRPQSNFVPYKSPLQYFRAYRFHPNYHNSVPGGWKSLTYSSKIDPSKALCPSELESHQCPRGEACEFQHFISIAPPDDHILLELGNADEYTGDQKNQFIQGLRDVLQDFRARKIIDFETIAQGIIEYRSRFLGDKSKVLPLKGVTI